jgi:hypothetical protein
VSRRVGRALVGFAGLRLRCKTSPRAIPFLPSPDRGRRAKQRWRKARFPTSPTSRWNIPIGLVQLCCCFHFRNCKTQTRQWAVESQQMGAICRRYHPARTVGLRRRHQHDSQRRCGARLEPNAGPDCAARNSQRVNPWGFSFFKNALFVGRRFVAASSCGPLQHRQIPPT